MRWLTVLAALSVVASCDNSVLTPPTGPNTPYPCGVGLYLCDQTVCCLETDVCEHNPSRCEYFGPGAYGKRGDAGR